MKRLFLMSLASILPVLSTAESVTVFFGTSGANNSGTKGIYSTTFDCETGKLAKPVKLAAELASAGFQAKHPTLPVLYSTSADPATRGGAAASFNMVEGKSGTELVPLNIMPTGCGGSAHLAVDPTGSVLVMAQYGDGTVVVLPLAKDGSLMKPSQVIQFEKASNVTPRNDKPHPHNITFSPCGHFVLIPDLGADSTHIYKLDPISMTLRPHGKAKSAPGAGPRHMKFSIDGKVAYVLNELSLTIESFNWNANTGSLTRFATVKTLPEVVKAREQMNTASEIRVHPNGQFVYSANRGNDSISVFKVNSSDGSLKRLDFTPARVAWPRNFNIDPSGLWLIAGGQDSHNAGVFAIDQQSGLLTYQRQSSASVPSPICVSF